LSPQRFSIKAAARQISSSGITQRKFHACGWETFSGDKLRGLESCVSRWRLMAPILTAEDVVRRIAAECAYVDECGGVGIRLEPAAAIVRRYGEQFWPRRQRRPRPVKPTPFL